MIRANRKRRPTNKGRIQHVLKRMGHLCVVAAGLALIVGSGWWLNQVWSVETWTIRGVPEGLKTAIDEEINSMETRDFIHTRPSGLRHTLLTRLPGLADVSITRSLPDSLEITARERIPVALWQGPDGTVSLVDEKTVPYRALHRGEQLDLPLLRSSHESLGDAVNILLSMKRESAPRYEHLSELIDEGGSWKLNFERGQSWILPYGCVGRERMQALIVLMQQKRWRGGNWRIDARLPTRWFIRKSKMGGVV